MTVILYSRPGCHLCDMLKAKLRWIGREHPLQVHDVDVSGDPALEQKYGHRIPVVTIDGIEIADGVAGDEELRKKLGGRR
jgi:glutaredoxin